MNRAVEVLAPGQEFDWHVSGADAKMTWRISGWNGEALTPPMPLVFSGSIAEIRYKPVKLGWQELVVSSQDGSQGETRRGFVSGQAPKLSFEDFKFGVSSHLMRDKQTFLPSIDLIDKLGVAYDRDEMSWSMIQPHAADQWKWDGSDAIVSALQKRHVQMNATLDYTVNWASTRPGNTSIAVLTPGARSHLATRAAPRMEPWLAYVHAVVGRYKGSVHYWEIWNEPDNGFWQSSVAEYLTLFSETAKTIKQIDPHALVMNGGFCMVSLPPNPDFLAEFLPRADRTNWDIFAFHDYASFSDQLKRRDKVASLAAQNQITLPLWMNEGGMVSIGPSGERGQAITLAKRLATAPALGLGAYFIYDLNDGADQTNRQDTKGLVHYDLTPKPAYAVYQNLVRLLGGRKFLQTEHADGANGGSVWEHVYASNNASGDQVAIVWAEKAPQPMGLWFDKLQVNAVLDVMGNPLPYQSTAAGTLVAVGDEPVYLVGKPGGNWKPRVR